jgi:hypothetical protein
MANEDDDREAITDRDYTPEQRDRRAAQRDIVAALRDRMNDGQPGQDERDASARDRMEAMQDRLASARDRVEEEPQEPRPDAAPGPAHRQSNGIPASRQFPRTRRPT